MNMQYICANSLIKIHDTLEFNYCNTYIFTGDLLRILSDSAQIAAKRTILKC
jgi:hypothetical protein